VTRGFVIFHKIEKKAHIILENWENHPENKARSARFRKLYRFPGVHDTLGERST
jgi:hypothetical protein